MIFEYKRTNKESHGMKRLIKLKTGFLKDFPLMKWQPFLRVTWKLKNILEIFHFFSGCHVNGETMFQNSATEKLGQKPNKKVQVPSQPIIYNTNNVNMLVR